MNINWSDKYLLGIPQIDEQHKKLIDISYRLNELLEDSQNDRIDNYDDIVTIFNELKNYADFHFRFEEKLMEEKNYVNLNEHKRMHFKFIQYVSQFDLDKVDENQRKALIELVNFVVNWILEHILQEDKKYQDVLLQK